MRAAVRLCWRLHHGLLSQACRRRGSAFGCSACTTSHGARSRGVRPCSGRAQSYAGSENPCRGSRAARAPRSVVFGNSRPDRQNSKKIFVDADTSLSRNNGGLITYAHAVATPYIEALRNVHTLRHSLYHCTKSISSHQGSASASASVRSAMRSGGKLVSSRAPPVEQMTYATARSRPRLGRPP